MRAMHLFQLGTFFFFFFFFFGGRDIHYINATITTSKKRDVHCKL